MYVHVCTYHKVFYVAKEMSEVDVEEVSRGGDHDVVIVTVSYALWSGDTHVTVM